MPGHMCIQKQTAKPGQPKLGHFMAFGYNNNNQACQSQASWGRLELRPNKHRQLRFRNVKRPQ
jgi:hypothetical protein